jgi:NADH dehydrogenase
MVMTGKPSRPTDLCEPATCRGARFLKSLPLELEKGRVVVGPSLELSRCVGCRRLGGDRGPNFEDTLSSDRTARPPTGPSRRQDIRPRLNGQESKAFQSKAPGQLSSIGRRTGVARIFGLKFSGIFAWILWRTVYLTKLPRLENKLCVGLQWALDVVFERDLGQYVTTQGVGSLNLLLERARKN